MIKLVATDLDDTLFTKDLTVTEKNIKALEFLKQNGVILILASGRPYPSVKKVAYDLQNFYPMITYQGALVYDPKNDKKLYGCEILPDDAKELVRLAKDEGIHVHIYIDNIWYVEAINEKTEYYKNLTKLEPHMVENLLEFIDRPVTKVLFFDEHERLKALKESLPEDFSKKFNIMFSKPFFLEFTDINVSKGNALKFLTEYYGLKREEVMAIGDGDNDISMIEYAGIGVAVENAVEKLKEAADFVVAKSDDSGFAQAIEKVFNVHF
ncbi:Cof-like hydrolase [Caldicellulosiruptor hydrothermalis 108]|uniref:Cof-like hydrolase n=1 Tax=Caldicellulosiruptor hydrothermalis (strain DSM 18901 / VKM B-2411 / 108) TaxID=632292 RepID=E4QD80_CALH1|nr:Cof-type HAD-IIB family hydrolase [Caldicellulosiruptor hydrothermalis]ADQ06375.1 Cof-like hydrolase [Caldicellulosiruptor hydrothermalis 108]